MRIFLSYSRIDRKLVEELEADLVALGHQVWIDRHIHVSRAWEIEIFQNILNCDLFLLATTRTSVRSEFCETEFLYAQQLNKHILAVVLDTEFMTVINTDDFVDRPMSKFLHKNQWLKYMTTSADELRQSMRLLASRLHTDFNTSNPLAFPLPKTPTMPTYQPLEAVAISTQRDGHSGRVESAMFSPDGKMIVSAAWDRKAILWDAKTLTPLHILEHTRTVSSACFSPDGNSIATSSWDGTVYVWDLKGHKKHELMGHSDQVRSVNYSPDGDYLVSTGDMSQICLWDAHKEKMLGELVGHQGNIVKHASFSPDGSQIISSTYSDGAEVLIWDVAAQKKMGELQGHEDGVYTARYGPDGTLIATASRDGTARIWSATTLKELHRLLGHRGRVYGVRFSPNPRYVVTCGADNTVRVWDLTQEREMCRLEGHEDKVLDAAFSPDSKFIVTACYDCKIRLFEIDLI